MYSAVLIGVVIAFNGLMLMKLLDIRSTVAGWSACAFVVAFMVSLASVWDSATLEKLDQMLIGAVFCA